MESAAQDIHENMRSVVDYQTHHRLREAQVGPQLLLYLEPEFKNCKFKIYRTRKWIRVVKLRLSVVELGRGRLHFDHSFCDPQDYYDSSLLSF